MQQQQTKAKSERKSYFVYFLKIMSIILLLHREKINIFLAV